jgi:hypothetical protein
MINLKEIINNCNKYHYIYIDINKNKPIKYKSYPEKQKNISIKNKEKLVLIKLKTITKKLYKLEKKSPIKVSGGPLYAEVNVYSIVDGKIIKEKSKSKNKIYFPKKYLKKILEKNNGLNLCKIIKKDVLKICKNYMEDKIKQGLIAINNITDL